jgi:hypothetical protein
MYKTYNTEHVEVQNLGHRVHLGLNLWYKSSQVQCGIQRPELEVYKHVMKECRSENCDTRKYNRIPSC